jgi:tetrahydromethanopterin S-methyltransferase subunit D
MSRITKPKQIESKFVAAGAEGRGVGTLCLVGVGFLGGDEKV